MSINNIYFIYILEKKKPALQEFMIEIVRVVENTAGLFVYRVVAGIPKKKNQLTNVSFQKRMLNIIYV